MELDSQQEGRRLHYGVRLSRIPCVSEKLTNCNHNGAINPIHCAQNETEKQTTCTTTGIRVFDLLKPQQMITYQLQLESLLGYQCHNVHDVTGKWLNFCTICK
jgi:hypothetical protein